ncbi:MAG: NADH-quinone oxidoreductase subunit I [Dehalococcoidia bacterium]|nr:NADH-quinone oxidoreductase subunit I [Dehalococcoidia bacterium]
MIGMFKGLATTLSVFTRKPVTIQYPDERHVLPVRQRSFPVLTWDFDHDEPFCTGCNVCVRNCPVDCMTATMVDNPKYAEGTSDRRKIVEKFWIDYARCMRCNICVEVCPFEAIVMDNNWSGHEHASYDRLDLHKDIDDLLHPSKSGELTQPFRPQDRIEYVERVARGEEPPETAFKGALPEARQRQQERLARGEEAAIRLREPQQPKESKKGGGAAAGGAAGAGAQSLLVDAEGNPLSDRKIRAKRMKAERAAKEAQDKGEAIPDDVMQMLIATKSDMAPADAKAAAGPAAGAAPAAPGASPLLQDAEGNPLSENKIRAKRIKAERSAKEAQDKGEAIPDDVMQMLIATDSDMAPAEAKAAAASAAPAAAPAGPDTSSPLLQDAEGNPLSENKIRAKRIKAERTAKEAQDNGEAIPDDVMQMLIATGSELAPQPAGGGGAPAAEAAPAGPDTSHPELQDAEGNPLSENKIRAKRMKAEKQAKEHLASGEAIPDELQALITAAGGTVPTSAD